MAAPGTTSDVWLCDECGRVWLHEVTAHCSSFIGSDRRESCPGVPAHFVPAAGHEQEEEPRSAGEAFHRETGTRIPPSHGSTN